MIDRSMSCASESWTRTVLPGVVALNGKPFLDGGMGKVFQFSTINELDVQLSIGV